MHFATLLTAAFATVLATATPVTDLAKRDHSVDIRLRAYTNVNCAGNAGRRFNINSKKDFKHHCMNLNTTTSEVLGPVVAYKFEYKDAMDRRKNVNKNCRLAIFDDEDCKGEADFHEPMDDAMKKCHLVTPRSAMMYGCIDR